MSIRLGQITLRFSVFSPRFGRYSFYTDRFKNSTTLGHLRAKIPGEGTPIWNGRGCSSKILNLTPKGDHLGVAQAFCDP